MEDSPSSRPHPAVSLQAASAAEPASCRFALHVFAPLLRFESSIGVGYKRKKVNQLRLTFC